MSKPPSTIGKYLRGVDFSNYAVENFDCSRLESLESLQWLKLNHGNFKEIPSILGLKNLESVTMMKNDLENIEETFTKMKSIKVLNLRKNNLKNTGKFMTDLDLSNLTILDLSNNRLNDIFFNLSSCKHIMVLNICRNDISYLPEHIFQCTGIKHLDISSNKIETLPSLIYSLANLQHMNISENPIHSFPMSDGKSLFPHMKVLHMSRLQLKNFQTEFSEFLKQCPAVTELDVSNNEIKEIPKSIFKCGKLERLVLNSNLIEAIPSSIGTLKRLKYLNISFNKIREFPSSIGKLKYMKRIYANGNIIESTGIPESISSLLSLEYLHLAANKLQTIGTFVLCCVNLKSLNLRNNDLRTLPPLREMMKSLQDLDVRGNPNLIIPRRTLNKDPFTSYNFGYENVRNFVVAMLKYQQKLNQEKKIAEKEALAAIKKQKKLNRPLKQGNKVIPTGQIPLPPPLMASSSLTAKKSITDVRRNIFGIPISDDVDEPDMSDVFPEDVGQNPGIYIMNIQNTLPVLIPDEQIGTFYSDDCYLILHSESENGCSLDHRVFIWIGKNAHIEKKTCVAVHSISLKGYVGYRESVIRIEDSDPLSFSSNSDATKALGLLMPALGGRYQVKDGSASSKSEKDRKVKTVKTTFYRLVLNNLKQVKANLWPFLETWIDDRYAYILDREDKLYLYLGRKTGVSLKVKARLFLEKIKSADRNDHAEIVDVNMEDEHSSEFWQLLGSKPSNIIMNPCFAEHNDFKPVLYKVVVGQGFIELPQVDQPDGLLKQNLLSSSCAYILDTYCEVYSWYGRKVPIPLRKASDHLAQEILDFVSRPTSAAVVPLRQDFESLVFKSNFVGWADMLGGKQSKTSLKVSFSYRNSLEELNKPKESQPVSASTFNLPDMDICSIFLPRSLITSEKSNEIILQSDEDLDSLQSLVMDRQGSLVPLFTHEFGHFYTHSAYAFICRYLIAVDDDEDESSEQSEAEKRGITDDDNEDETDEDSKCMDFDVTKKFCLYFWEGIKAPKSCWLNYSFKYQKIFQQQFKNKLEVIRVQQNHEPLEFKALFKHRFILHKGFRPSSVPISTEINDGEPIFKLHDHLPKMYQVRTYQRQILSACIETTLSADYFAKDFCNIIVTKNPLHTRDESSDDSALNSNADKCKIYLWIGSEASEEDSEAASEFYVKRLGEAFGCTNTIVTVKEKEELEDFLSLFPSSKFSIQPIEVSIMKWVRLFSFGFHSNRMVVEEMFPFSCTNLRESSVSLVDSGSKLYLYMGEHVSQGLRQFLLRLLPIYQEQQKKKNYGAPERKVVLVKHQKEPIEFKRLFHGWFMD